MPEVVEAPSLGPVIEVAGEEAVAKKVEQYLNETSYAIDPNYVPSDFALELVNFIKMVEGGRTENKTPVVHYHMLDKMMEDNGLDTLNMCHRGLGKSTLKEYLILYMGTFNHLPGFGAIPYGLYVSDSIENGVKKMRKALQFRWDNSTFLQTYIPKTNFTDLRYEFINTAKQSTVFSGHGAKTGVRGTRENNSRPVIALLDDLISDEDARSPTVIASVEDTVYKAVEQALHPTRRKIVWSGTPFNERDPLYKAVESGAWNVNVYPICETFPCSREEFRGSWEDRFTYDAVMARYQKALKAGKIDAFNQELMLRIMSDEDRMILDSDIRWYRHESVLQNRGSFNFYITTDFATSEKQASDFSVISVWALNSNGDWFWVDGICARQDMGKTINDLFRLVQMYRPMEVGIEVSGQQAGFIPWIQDQMGVRNCWFNLATKNNSGAPGIQPATNKMQRFTVVEPWFKAGKMYFPIEKKNSPAVAEGINELRLVAKGGFKSKHDDFIDTISMLALLNTFRPGNSVPATQNTEDGIYGHEVFEETSRMDSYLA